MAERTVTQKACVVYWLFDATCVCPWRHGYVGVTAKLESRIKQHRWSQVFPLGFSSVVIYRGTADECFTLEERLRPEHGIGWNRLRGGHKRNHSLGYKYSAEVCKKLSIALKGKKRTKETCERIRQATLGHVRSMESRAKQSAAIKGRPKSLEWRARMSEMAKARGGFGPRKHSAETRALLCEQRRGNKHWRKRKAIEDIPEVL